MRVDEDEEDGEIRGASIQTLSVGQDGKQNPLKFHNFSLRIATAISRHDTFSNQPTNSNSNSSTFPKQPFLSTNQSRMRHDQRAPSPPAWLQTVVIKQLMERSESSGKERESAVATLSQVDEDNHVLRVNLHQHTLVNTLPHLTMVIKHG